VSVWLTPPAGAASLCRAILALDLEANGIDLGEKKLDATVAATLEIPR
jgi:hypothetical protein